MRIMTEDPQLTNKIGGAFSHFGVIIMNLVQDLKTYYNSWNVQTINLSAFGDAELDIFF